jgi:hypothetical protein
LPPTYFNVELIAYRFKLAVVRLNFGTKFEQTLGEIFIFENAEQLRCRTYSLYREIR